LWEEVEGNGGEWKRVVFIFEKWKKMKRVEKIRVYDLHMKKNEIWIIICFFFGVALHI